MIANYCRVGGSERLVVILAATAMAASTAAPATTPAPSTPAGVSSSAPGGQRLDDETLAGLLAAADDAQARAGILQHLGETAIACPALTRFGDRRDPVVREQAVRAMDQAECAAIEYYRPFMRDPHPWVTDALVTAIERHRIGEGIPFLIGHLSDPRRILSGGGIWSIGERAHRALRAVSCQSLHFDPAGSAQEQARAAARWTTWYADHGSEPRARWIEEGFARAREYLQQDRVRLRREGLQLLLLIGAPAAPELRAAFRRGPAELEASLSCTPDEPPRVTEEVPCLFAVANGSERRVAFIPGALKVALRRQGAAADEGSPALDDHPSPSAEAPGPGTEMADWLDHIVDLAPGERLERAVVIGPVSTAGRYEVAAALIDLSAGLVHPDGRTKSGGGMAIEARTVVRFNQ
jgi:hypothetical protein